MDRAQSFAVTAFLDLMARQGFNRDRAERMLAFSEAKNKPKWGDKESLGHSMRQTYFSFTGFGMRRDLFLAITNLGDWVATKQ